MKTPMREPLFFIDVPLPPLAPFWMLSFRYPVASDVWSVERACAKDIGVKTSNDYDYDSEEDARKVATEIMRRHPEWEISVVCSTGEEFFL
jgi:hypothetical protein